VGCQCKVFKHSTLTNSHSSQTSRACTVPTSPSSKRIWCSEKNHHYYIL